MDQRYLDTSDWPKQANLTDWARLLGLSKNTMYKYVGNGKLHTSKQFNGIRLATREAIMACWNIKHREVKSAEARR
jgi:predicted site-specific integrase-resolvase